ncbi:hypothetical protein F511_18209 [Dorcoceras hygrometricum]|uniref:Vinorine synthase-like n=1 Tax=Dorcoceras hygrometricum TaxID=472368 RepID=A0A2Z7BFI8_9LAMI|nr:hypothetical protein F511_18209 [Dorcoceras hygrometricum]
MDIEIVAKEMIKPSSPTPNHLKNYKLCLLDQLIPAAYAPIVLLYPNQDVLTDLQVLQRIALLKKSLSQILVRFYPLAGTIGEDDISVDCDDRGACFTTAKVRNSLHGFLENPDLRVISHFLSFDESYVTNIQASVFECGGIAIGVCISHRILDGTALSTFLKAWSTADVAADSSIESPVINTIYPDFSASSLFPVDDHSQLKQASMAMWGCLFKKGQFVTKRFVFDRSAITALKEMAAGGDRRCATSVEAVSGFIWKSAVAAVEELRFGTKRPSLLTHVVNLRKRASPSLSETSFGNLIWMANAKLHAVSDRNLGFSSLVELVRKSISKIDGDYAKKLRGKDGLTTMLKYLKEIEEFGSKDVDYYGFTSWCKLGFYDVDFGWGSLFGLVALIPVVLFS